MSGKFAIIRANLLRSRSTVSSGPSAALPVVGQWAVRHGIAAPELHLEHPKQNILPTPHRPFRTTKSPAFWNERQDFLKLDIGKLVGARGFEPPTPCSRSRCATRLRYAPTVSAELQSCPGICKGLFADFSMHRMRRLFEAPRLRGSPVPALVPR